MDVAGVFQQLLGGDHGDVLFAGGPGGLFQVQLLRHGDDEHVEPLGRAYGDQGLEHLFRREAGLAGHGHAVDLAVGAVIEMSAVSHACRVQQPHDVGLVVLFAFVLGHSKASLKPVQVVSRWLSYTGSQVMFTPSRRSRASSSAEMMLVLWASQPCSWHS